MSPAPGRVHGAVAVVSLWMARAGGCLLVIVSFLISFEILARKLLLLPFGIGTELSSYALAIGASWSFAYALLHRAHVRIDVLRNLLPTAMQALLDLLALLSLTALALVLTWYAFDTAETSWSLGARENTTLGTPLIIPHGLWLVGLAWFALVCLEQLAAALLALARDGAAAVIRHAGPAAPEDEIGDVLALADPPLTGARQR